MPIANFFIKKLLGVFRNLNHYDEEDIDVIRYGLEASFWEIEKFVYMTIIFIALGLGWDFLAATIAVMTIRPMAGGYHASTAWRCFMWTIFGFILALIVLPLIALNNAIVISVALFSLVTTFIASPFRSEQMERIAKKEKDKQKRNIATVVTAIWFIVLFINQQHFLAAPILWIIFLQNVQLLIPWYKRNFKKAT